MIPTPGYYRMRSGLSAQIHGFSGTRAVGIARWGCGNAALHTWRSDTGESLAEDWTLQIVGRLPERNEAR